MAQVAVCAKNPNSSRIPQYIGWKNIPVLTPSGRWHMFSPYCLKDAEGRIFENIWQFSKVYANVPKSTQYYSRWDATVIWDHPEEKHVDYHVDGTHSLTDEYYAWRAKGFGATHAVRYPVGFQARHKCLYTLHDGKRLDYISARKQLYIPLYCELAKQQTCELELLRKFYRSGQSLVVIEVDVPIRLTVITKEMIKAAIADPTKAFGHGYCLAALILDHEEWLYDDVM